MGKRVYLLPGGVPAYAGSENWAGADEESSLILATDQERFVDALNGNDTNAGTLLAPWLTLAPFDSYMSAFVRIDSVLTCWIVVASPESPPTANFASVTYPLLGQNGKIVYRSATSALVATFTAIAGSTPTAILSNTFPVGDFAGYSIRCTVGLNLGMRALVSEHSGAAPATIIPAGELRDDGVGDTWVLERPLATIHFPDNGGYLTGLSGGVGANEAAGGADAYNDAGIYFAELALTGEPLLSRCNVWLFGCEYNDLPGIVVATGAYVACGVATSGPMAWIGVDDGVLVRGWGLSQRRDTIGPASDGRLVIQGEVNTGGGVAVPNTVVGYLVGTTWTLRQQGSYGWGHGGHLWGADGRDPFACFGAWASLGTVQGAVPMRLDTQSPFTTFVSPIHAYQHAYVEVNSVVLDGGPSGCALLRAEGQSLIDAASGNAGSPAGVGGHAQSVVGWGMIQWGEQPAITGTVADMLLDGGVTAANAALAAANSVIVGNDAVAAPLPNSWIGRRA